jgi:hypothetical protein
MSEDFGNGVSRTLSAFERQFRSVVWQASKPPLDSELNLVAQIGNEALRDSVRSQMHSGFFLDPMSSDADFVTDKNWSNWFKLGRVTGSGYLWANVNGWIIPVTGTGVSDGDTSNRINLFQPPSSDTRIDLVFLEVWQAQVSPNPSTVNKPSASTVYKYGNAKFGGTNIPDDFIDPTIGYETTERVQLQYRIRVFGSGSGLGNSVDLAQYPDGLDDPSVLAQGATTGPVASYVWQNMKSVLGDAGLWRSGNGSLASRNALGTVDGYSYAIPVCAIFRRNSSPFVALAMGNANQNGSFDRNPISGAVTDPVQATRTFSSVTLTSGISETDSGLISVTGLAGSGVDNININWSNTVAMIGDEIVVLQGVSAAAGTIQIAATTDPVPYFGRGRFGTQALPHAAGTEIKFFTFRPDERFSDEICPEDVMDLRRSIIAGNWSYTDLLQHNLGKLLKGSLRTSYKQGNGTVTQGLQVIEVDTYLGKGTGVVPNQTEQLDGFDGIRTTFSDASVVQNDISLLLTPSGGAVSASANSWEVAADFSVSGFIPNGLSQWVNGSIIRLFLGGASGSDGARATSSSGERFMRFLSPKEYWLTRDEIKTDSVWSHGNQTPFLMRFVGGSGIPPQAWSMPQANGETASGHPGPMFPLPDYGFQTPFIVLGGVANTDLYDIAATTVSATTEIRFTGTSVNFDTAGQWYPVTGVKNLSTAGISKLLVQDKRNLYDLLTAGGKDPTGNSSELYLVLTDSTNATNLGCFRVIGAGIVGYTNNSASTSDAVVLSPIGASSAIAVNSATVQAEIRTQYTNTEDDPGSVYGSVVVVITDISGTEGGVTNPWGSTGITFANGDMVLDTSILYGSSRGAMARVPDALTRFTVEGAVSSGVEVLREAPENIDPSPVDIRNRTGVPEDEYYYSPQPVQTWNRLPSLGLHEPVAPSYGEGKFNFETLRESELFADTGSKTVVFRPFQQIQMSLPVRTTISAQIPAVYNDAVTPVDGASLFGTRTNIYAVPSEYMPRFGRQDVYIRSTAGTNGPYIGVNHLFSDTNTPGDPTLKIVGGTSSGGVLKIVTGASSGLTYGGWSSPNQWYQGRIYEDVNTRSSDLNKPLRGIQLPPYLGIARVYGVYDKRDFDVNGSAWLDAGFTPDTGAAAGKNLLRFGADKQTLFILKDGAADVISNSDAHTYMISEEAVDITLSPDYTAGQKFGDLEYVVEVAVFGFAQGFINKNCYVFNRGGVVPASGLVSAIRMILPAAMPSQIRGYSAYLRTVYQGDPYMTRDASTIQTADYEHRYGSIPVSDAFAVKAPVQQYSTLNVQIPEIPNSRSLEVLSTVDFWTTLGTGKMGGKVFAGTPTDVGSLMPTGTRIPSSISDNPLQPVPRAFSESQPQNTERAYIDLEITDNTQLNNIGVVVTRGSDAIAAYEGVDWFTGVDAYISAASIVAAINGSVSFRNTVGVQAYQRGTTVRIVSFHPGSTGTSTEVSLDFTTTSGIILVVPPSYGVNVYSSKMAGAAPVPVNAARLSMAPTPVNLTGMTERLPLGILVNDSDFIGEDPLRKGTAYEIKKGGGTESTEADSTFTGLGTSSPRLNGPEGYIGMADGSILNYTAYNALSAPNGTRRFRVYRGGGSAYVISPNLGSPLDFTFGGFSSDERPVLKGAILVGRAYLVRNTHETAFGGVTRTHGDELQMVIVTNTVYGEGTSCPDGYALSGMISPTDYGKGYAAADRYRLEGKPLMKSKSILPDSVVPLTPYPPEDPPDDDPCA